MHTRLFLAPLSFAIACGGSPQPGANSPSGTNASDQPCPDVPSPAVAQTDEIDPDLVALAEAAKKCSFENGSYEWNCPAFREWRSENDDLFEGPAGNNTILSMLEDSNVRTRTLATERGFTAARSYFGDPKRAARLLAVLDKEREPRLLSPLGKFAAYISGEKMLGEELRTLAKHPTLELRRSYAEHVLPQNPTAFSLEMVKVFLDDADDSVRRAAIRSLSANGRTRATEPICASLKGQLTRSDKLVGDALEAGSTSKCAGLAELVIAEIEKRSEVEASVLNDRNNPDFASSLGSLCWRQSTAEPVKQRAFDIAVKVTPKIEDTWRKRTYVGLFRYCDVKRAKDALAPYLKDKDKEIAEHAKDEVTAVEEQLKRDE